MAHEPKPTTSSNETLFLNYETSTLTTRGVNCVLHKWIPLKTLQIRGVAVVYHGFGAHSQFPTVRYVSSLLAENGFLVYGLDLPGHGLSPGTRGLLTGLNDVIQDGIAVAKYARHDSDNTALPLFLLGSSMGGAIALSVAKLMESETVEGVVLLAPMLSLKVGSLERTALSWLAMIAPSASLIPSSATSPEKQYRDPERRAECETDELSYKGKIRVLSALTCINLAMNVSESFEEIKIPFLCMMAEEDVVVDNAKVAELMEKATSEDKTLKTYAAFHGLLCEPAPLLGIIEDDLINWLVQRCV